LFIFWFFVFSFIFPVLNVVCTYTFTAFSFPWISVYE
jgi:hypothetical protein